MQIRYYKEYSRFLNRFMEFKVYGHAGRPIVIFPCQSGRFFDWEDRNMCNAAAPWIDSGKLQIFSWEAEQGLLAGMEQGGLIQKADTLEELAEKLNMPADAFVATVERYNELCAKGEDEDEDFGKESYRMLPLENPPYYGCRQGATVLCTLDGLRINTKMQVLDTEGNPIEGLYSAGDCSGGFFAHNYPEYIVGVAIGRTLTEGYLLGDELAKA